MLSSVFTVPFLVLVISSFALVHGKNDTATAINDITAMEYDAWKSKVSNILTSLNVTEDKDWIAMLDTVPANQVRMNIYLCELLLPIMDGTDVHIRCDSEGLPIPILVVFAVVLFLNALFVD
jgi:phosphate/sulfate permease